MTRDEQVNPHWSFHPTTSPLPRFCSLTCHVSIMREDAGRLDSSPTVFSPKMFVNLDRRSKNRRSQQLLPIEFWGEFCANNCVFQIRLPTWCVFLEDVLEMFWTLVRKCLILFSWNYFAGKHRICQSFVASQQVHNHNSVIHLVFEDTPNPKSNPKHQKKNGWMVGRRSGFLLGLVSVTFQGRTSWVFGQVALWPGAVNLVLPGTMAWQEMGIWFFDDFNDLPQKTCVSLLAWNIDSYIINIYI